MPAPTSDTATHADTGSHSCAHGGAGAAADMARVDLWRYVAACYYEPTEAFVEEHLFESMRRAALSVDTGLAEQAEQLGAAFAADDMQTLLVDYTRLFLGPMKPHAQPYGSFWLTGEYTVMQEATLSVLDLYEQGGFAVDDAFQELPDHVAVELEFVYQLAFRQHQARLTGDEVELARLTGVRQQFMAVHLGAWAGHFCTALQAGAETGFYRQLGAFTARLVQLESA
ncbi:MAG: hypothetical protein RLY71_4347 [Pseudomonadota bacterium]|jgi:TorA maturation chaperone TorD